MQDKKTPEGPYCYNVTDDKDFMSGRKNYISIDPCPYYKHIKGINGWCELLNCEITDMIKECETNNKEDRTEIQ